jgi:hypothetical protein
MDQSHIQNDSTVRCYLDLELTPEERSSFEGHLVDCEECRDRVLLAEMFHVRNGLAKLPPPEKKLEAALRATTFQPRRREPLPKRARFIIGLEPWQIWVILILAALLLVSIPTGYFLLTGYTTIPRN